MVYELAQVNIARLRAPLDDPAIAEFVAALGPVNAAADGAPGFRWRLKDDSGDATAIQAFTWDAGESAGVIVNLTVWADLESLGSFVYGELHRLVLRRRRQWFQTMSEAWTTCWWVPGGERPTTDDAEDRLRHLRLHGPTSYAFTLQHSYPAPGTGPVEPAVANNDWLCPA